MMLVDEDLTKVKEYLKLHCEEVLTFLTWKTREVKRKQLEEKNRRELQKPRR